ncbi:hypothetical protein H4R35_000728 [Dimargaris xerosporica]|nr:hypothetical protein H4R35_000728 [Dimargaris xerosporica]
MTLFNPTAWLGLMVDLGCLAFLTVYAYDALVASPTAVLTQLCPAVYALHMVTLLLPSRSRPPTSPRSPKRPQSIWQVRHLGGYQR